MQYLCLIYSADDAEPKPGTPEFGVLMQGYNKFTAEVSAAGQLVNANAQP